MIDLRKPYQWEETNDQLKAQLKTPYQVRFYQSLQQALLETVMGFQNLYSHKRQFASHVGLGTHAEEAMLFLSRQGIKNLEISNEQSSDEKKNIVHLLDLDDAITAEIYQNQHQIDEKLFRISISHHLHLFAKIPPTVKDTEVLIWSLPEGAIAFHGKRCVSLPTILAPTLSSTALPSLPLPLKTENKTWVQHIEAEALRQTLITDHAIPETQLEALSLSRWNELKLITQFEKRAWSPEILRGTLILSSELSADTNLAKKIETAVTKLRSLSTF